MWRLIFPAVLVFTLAQRASAQSVDWPALLKDAEQAARQVSDEKERRALLVDIAVAYIAGKIEGAERLIEETRTVDGKCAEAVATAYSFMDGANPPICRANGPATFHSLNDLALSEAEISLADLVAKLERGDVVGAFGGYPVFDTRQKRLYFIAFIAQWLVINGRVDGIAAIAALPTDNITKDDFHRLVAWHAGRFGKSAMARRAIAAIQSKTERFAASVDLATHLLLNGRLSESEKLFREGLDLLTPEERLRAFLGGKSMVEHGQFVGWFDYYAPRPFFDPVGVTPRFGPVTFLALAQMGVGDWEGLRRTLEFIDEIVARADLNVEDYPWQITICYIALGHLLAANNYLADRSVGQLRRWLATNTIEELRDQRRALVDWTDAWQIAVDRSSHKDGLAQTLELVATVPEIVQTAIVLRALNTDWKAAILNLQALPKDRRRKLGVFGALSFFRPDDSSFHAIARFMMSAIDRPQPQDYVELDRLVLRAIDNGVDTLQFPAAERQKFMAVYRRELPGILIRVDEIDAARRAALRCKEQINISSECRAGFEFLMAALSAKRFDLALAELRSIADHGARASAGLRILQADWARRHRAVVIGN